MLHIPTIVGVDSATEELSLWLFTTVLTDRVTVKICGLDVPEISVTVMTSPFTLMSKGKSLA